MKNSLVLASALAMALCCTAAARAQQQPVPGQLDGPMTEAPAYKAAQKSTATQPAATPKPADSPSVDTMPTMPAGSIPPSAQPPRSEGESSSNTTKGNTKAPSMDKLAHPEGGHVGDEALVNEMHQWNPMRAMKDVEVGDFYYNEGNFKAALSRYREALEFKPRDAEATFHLAQTLEKLKQDDEARATYEEYLKILKHGPRELEVSKALARLKK